LRLSLGTKEIALMSVFAALIVMISRLPGIPIIGFPGSKIELSVVIYPLIGILLGARIGAISVLLGNFLIWLIPTSTLLGLLMIPAGVLAALVAGSLRSNHRIINWKLAFAVLAALNVSWYLTPIGLEAPFYPVLHWIALALVALFRENLKTFLESDSRRRLLLGTGVCSYAALMSDSMAGNLIFIYAVGWVVPLRSVLSAVESLGMLWVKLGIPKLPFTGLTALFMSALIAMAIERTIMTVISTLIGSALLRLLGKGRYLISS